MKAKAKKYTQHNRHVTKHKRKTKKRPNRLGKKRKDQSTQKITQCSPKPHWATNSFSCYTNMQLIRLRNEWNKQHPSQPLLKDDPLDIHRFFKKQFNTCGENELCWLNQPAIYNKLLSADLRRSFRPKKPTSWQKNPVEWLSDVDITNVLTQYERAYKCFKFLGPSPIDFAEKMSPHSNQYVDDNLAKFQLSHYINKGILKIGIILNTDPHTKSGSHWISLFINLKRNYIFFFDSVGNKAPPQVNHFVKMIINQASQLSPPIHLIYDTNEGHEHQTGNTECGIYSLYVVVNLLEDKFTTQYLKTHTINDKFVFQFRDKYFR